MKCISYVLHCKTASGSRPAWLNKKKTRNRWTWHAPTVLGFAIAAVCKTLENQATAHGPAVQQNFPLLLPDQSAAARYLIASADQINITLQGSIWFLADQPEPLSCCKALCFIGRFATTWPRTHNLTDVSTSHWQIRDAILVWSLLIVTLQLGSVCGENDGHSHMYNIQHNR